MAAMRCGRAVPFGRRAVAMTALFALFAAAAFARHETKLSRKCGKIS